MSIIGMASKSLHEQYWRQQDVIERRHKAATTDADFLDALAIMASTSTNHHHFRPWDARRLRAIAERVRESGLSRAEYSIDERLT